MKKSLGSSPAKDFTLMTRKGRRIKKGLRAFAKSLVHLSSSRGEKVGFDDETRKKLLSALSRPKPTHLGEIQPE